MTEISSMRTWPWWEERWRYGTPNNSESHIKTTPVPPPQNYWKNTSWKASEVRNTEFILIFMTLWSVKEKTVLSKSTPLPNLENKLRIVSRGVILFTPLKVKSHNRTWKFWTQKKKSSSLYIDLHILRDEKFWREAPHHLAAERHLEFENKFCLPASPHLFLLP